MGNCCSGRKVRDDACSEEAGIVSEAVQQAEGSAAVDTGYRGATAELPNNDRITGLKQQISRLTDENARLSEDARSARASATVDISSLQEQVKRLTEERTALQSRLRASVDEGVKKGIEAVVAELISVVPGGIRDGSQASLSQFIDGLKADIHNAFAEVERENAAVLSRKDADLQTLTGKFQSCQAESGRLRDRVVYLEAEKRKWEDGERHLKTVTHQYRAQVDATVLGLRELMELDAAIDKLLEAAQRHQRDPVVAGSAVSVAKVEAVKDMLNRMAAVVPTMLANHTGALGNRTHSTASTKAANYAQPVQFSTSCKDIRIQATPWQGEMRVDLREWYSSGRSTKGISIPVPDAAQLALILPDVVAQAQRMQV